MSIPSRTNPSGGAASGTGLTAAQETTLEHFVYDASARKLRASRAIETTLNSLYLGEQHKMSSGAENIFFTNLTSDINWYPVWGGLKDQSIPANQDHTGFISPSARVYGDMISTPLGGDFMSAGPDNSIGYIGDNPFTVNIAGLGITTVVAETVPTTQRLLYVLRENNAGGNKVYEQELLVTTEMSDGTTLTWFFDHPVEIHAGMTIHAAIYRIDRETNANLGVLQVRKGDDGTGRYWATVHNRTFEDKDIEYISPYLKSKTMDFSADATGANIIFKDLSLPVGEQVLKPHPVNTISAVANGANIRIMVKDGQKIIIEDLPVSGATVNGSAVNAVLASALVQLNDLFTHATSFSSAGGDPVTGLALSGDDLTVTLQSGTSYTVDVTSLGVDENKYVSSGALSGSNLVLTMTDSTTVSINAQNMINGSTLPAVGVDWRYAHGSNAGDAVTPATFTSFVRDNSPLYHGELLSKGEELTWTHTTEDTYMIGTWSGSTDSNAIGNVVALDGTNWTARWRLEASQVDHITGSSAVHKSKGIDIDSRFSSGYGVDGNTVFTLRYAQDNHLYLRDSTEGQEVIIAKTNLALDGNDVAIYLAGEDGAGIPVVTLRKETWNIVHDYDSSESGEWSDGIEDHTVLKSTLDISPGEQAMVNLNFAGRANYIGVGYGGAASGNATAESDVDMAFCYGTSEQILPLDDWTLNTNAQYYEATTPKWQVANGTNPGMLSIRYKTNNVVEVWSEDHNELIMTSSTALDGSDFQVHFGVRESTPINLLPTASRQTIGQGSQPVLTFAPDIVSQVLTVTEGISFNAQIATSAGGDIANMYAESDAPAWAILNQATGVFSGTAPAFQTGGGSNDYVVNCKAGNAIGGVVSFQVTLRVVEPTYTNTKSLKFLNGINSYLGGNPANMTALARAANGAGSGDAWSIGIWFKRTSTSTAGQTIWMYGGNTPNSEGFIEIKQTATTKIRLRYGTNNNYLQLLTPADSIALDAWSHILVTYDGGTTGVASGSVNDYYTRFKVFVNGSEKTLTTSQGNYGWDGSLKSEVLKVGQRTGSDYLKDSLINQIVIWDSDQSGNVAGIYNGGNTQDMTNSVTMSGTVDGSYTTPANYYEIGDSVSTIPDINGSCDLTGYNFTSSDLIDDAP